MILRNWSESDVPDQSGRIAIVTGANTGLGFDTARVLAEHGATVVMAVRNLDKGKEAADRILSVTPDADIVLQRLDLGSLRSVREAAGELRGAYPRIDLLINNAGVMIPPKQVTEDGFELQFGTNSLGHFALTGLLLDNMLTVAGSRVVIVSSNFHKLGGALHFDDLNWERTYNRSAAYAQSKLANLMFCYELQRRLAAAGKPTIAVAAHPGLHRLRVDAPRLETCPAVYESRGTTNRSRPKEGRSAAAIGRNGARSSRRSVLGAAMALGTQRLSHSGHVERQVARRGRPKAAVGGL